MEEKKYTHCQSCGMPLDKDPQGGGTDADGTRSDIYCSNCFQEGVFTAPMMDVTRMQEIVEKKLKEIGIPDNFIEKNVQKIPELERWKK